MKLNRLSPIQFFALVGLALATISSEGQDLGDTVSQAGLFSYQAPKGWTIKSTDMSKYQIAFEAPRNGFAANINVGVESYPKSLADYVAANKQALSSTTVFTHFQIVSEQPFETSAGVKGVRLVAKDGLGKVEMEQTWYFFEGASNNMFVVTASCLAGDGDQYAPIFDASLKTLSLQ